MIADSALTQREPRLLQGPVQVSMWGGEVCSASQKTGPVRTVNTAAEGGKFQHSSKTRPPYPATKVDSFQGRFCTIKHTSGSGHLLETNFDLLYYM